MENKTAVEWLFEKLWEAPKDKLNWYAIRKQAKQMERKQIEESFNVGWFESQKPSSVVEYSSASKYFTKKYQNGKDS